MRGAGEAGTAAVPQRAGRRRAAGGALKLPSCSPPPRQGAPRAGRRKPLEEAPRNRWLKPAPRRGPHWREGGRDRGSGRSCAERRAAPPSPLCSLPGRALRRDRRHPTTPATPALGGSGPPASFNRPPGAVSNAGPGWGRRKGSGCGRP